MSSPSNRETATKKEPFSLDEVLRRRSQINLGHDLPPAHLIEDDDQDTAFEKELFEIEKDIVRKIPADFRVNPSEFRSTRQVVRLLKSGDERDLEDLEKLFQLTDAALDSLVQGYFKGFNRSTRNFSRILTRFSDASDTVNQSRTDLAVIKELLAVRASELRKLWLKSVQYKEMGSLLDEIEHVCTVSGRLEGLILQKQYLVATELLSNTLSKLQCQPLASVQALQGVFADLQLRSQVFHEDLISEITSFLYLKATSAQSDSSVSSTSQAVENILSGEAESTGPNVNALLMSHFAKLLARDVEAAEPQSDAVSTQSRPDSWDVVRRVAEALARLQRMPVLVRALRAEQETELCLIIERAIVAVEDGVRERNLSSSELLKEFLSSLFKKFKAVLVRHMWVILILRSHPAVLKAREEAEKVPDDLTQDEFPWFNLYELTDVWAVMQRLVVDILSAVLGPSPDTFSGGIGTSYKSLEKPIFSFSVSSFGSGLNSHLRQHNEEDEDPTLANPCGAEVGPLSRVSLLIAPSPYHITAIYRTLTEFVADMAVLVDLPSLPALGSADGLDAQSPLSLAEFVENFIGTTFHEIADEEIQQRSGEAANSPTALRPDTGDGERILRQRAHTPLLLIENSTKLPLTTTVIVNASLAEFQIHHLSSLPNDAPHLTAVAETNLLRFISFVQGKISGLFESTYAQSAMDECPHILELAHHHPTFAAAVNSALTAIKASFTPETPPPPTPTPATALFAPGCALPRRRHAGGETEKSREARQLFPDFEEDEQSETAFRRLLGDFEAKYLSLKISIPTMGILQNEGSLTALGCTISSLLWFAEVLELLLPTSDPAAESTSLLPGRICHANMESLVSLLGHLTLFSKKLRDLALHTFLLLVFNIRGAVMYYLAPLRFANFAVGRGGENPEQVVLDCCAFLSRAYDALKPNLPDSLLGYVFSDLDTLCAQQLKQIAAHIPLHALTPSGVNKMHRNAFAIHQTLIQLHARPRAYLDKVRPFFELARLSAAELQAHYGEQGPQFSPSDYSILISRFVDPSAEELEHLQRLCQTLM